MLSLATSKSKKPSAQPPDPNIRLGIGETAARRSFFFACGILANVYFWPNSDLAGCPSICRLSGESGRTTDHQSPSVSSYLARVNVTVLVPPDGGAGSTKLT
jgi:hypothetical protein